MIKSGILIQKRGALSEQINTSSEAIYFYFASIVCVCEGQARWCSWPPRSPWVARERERERVTPSAFEVVALEGKRSWSAIGSLERRVWKQMRVFKAFREMLPSRRIDYRAARWRVFELGLRYQS